MRERHRPFTEEEIRGLMTQLLQGLVHMHKSEYFHRDLKPGMDSTPWDLVSGSDCQVIYIWTE